MTSTHTHTANRAFATIPAIAMGGMVRGRRLVTLFAYACRSYAWKGAGSGLEKV